MLYSYTIKDINNVGIDLPELIRLKPIRLLTILFTASSVGIDLPELIRLKPYIHSHYVWFYTASGLICLNWYDWNMLFHSPIFIPPLLVGIDLPELIRLKLVPIRLTSPWLCPGRDWSAWIDTIETSWWFLHWPSENEVGIDLPELIRLKHACFNYWTIRLNRCRDWSAWIDTIETK